MAKIWAGISTGVALVALALLAIHPAVSAECEELFDDLANEYITTSNSLLDNDPSRALTSVRNASDAVEKWDATCKR